MTLRPAAVLLAAVLCACQEPESPSPPLPAPSAPEIPSPPPEPLEPGRIVQRHVDAPAVDVYRVRLRSGELLDLTVDQDGVDALVVLRAADRPLGGNEGGNLGVPLREIDTPTGDCGPERLWWIAAEDADLLVDVRVPKGGGAYRISMARPRIAGESDVLRVAAQDAYVRGQAHDGKGETWLAAVAFADARELWWRAEEPFQEALSLSEQGRMAYRVNRLDEAVDQYRQALTIVRGLHEERQEVRLLNDLGLALQGREELERAAETYSSALDVARRIGHPRGEGAASHNLGIFHHLRGETDMALGYYERARAIRSDLGDARREGAVLGDMANCYMLLDSMPEALDALGRALELVRADQDPVFVARTLRSIGWFHHLQGGHDRALGYYRRALELRRDAEPDATTASILDRMGTAYAELGQYQEATECYRQALAIDERGGYLMSQGHTLGNLCRLQDRSGKPVQALESCERALEILHAVNDGPAEAYVLYLSARLERRLGGPRSALAKIRDCVGIVERLRTDAGREALRTSFFADRLRFYELHVDLLMELDRQEPGAGWDARALEVSERGRARSLLELLAKAGTDAPAGAAAELLDQQRWLEARIEKKIQEQSEARTGKQDAVERELRRLLNEHDQIEHEIRRARPRYAAHALPQPIREPAIRELLDDETVMLAYALGEERSFLWVIGRSTTKGHELPPRNEIEQRARAWYELLSDPARQQSAKGQRERVAKWLSDVLLRPAAASPGRRLVVLGDGALQYLPFAALPAPGEPMADPRPLLALHEVLTLPSASVLSVLRRQLADRPPAPGLLAVVADPVFDARDERFARPEPRDQDGRGFDRLPFAGREARAILDLASGGQTLLVDGFDANRERVTGGELGRYRIVHFATHGVLDASHPELSGIVLSGIDERGEPRPGFLRFHEIFNLDLPAELVVLSACRTALGPQIRGEGLIGLTRAFFAAGAPRVVVSLWNVEDEATAGLIERFYQGLLREGLSPAAALRTAQVAAWRVEPWRPYRWAGFVLQGEWRGFDTGMPKSSSIF